MSSSLTDSTMLILIPKSQYEGTRRQFRSSCMSDCDCPKGIVPVDDIYEFIKNPPQMIIGENETYIYE